MENIVMKTAKVAAGLGLGIIAAETVAISANAAFDDIETVKNAVVRKLNPEPVKKAGKLLGKAKKGGKR